MYISPTGINSITMQYALYFCECFCADQMKHLIERYKISDDVLKMMVSDEHICKLGESISWREVGEHLLNDKDKLQSIEDDPDEVEKGRAMLKEWQNKFLHQATYYKMIEAMVKAEKMMEALRVCKMIKPGE